MTLLNTPNFLYLVKDTERATANYEWLREGVGDEGGIQAVEKVTGVRVETRGRPLPPPAPLHW